MFSVMVEIYSTVWKAMKENQEHTNGDYSPGLFWLAHDFSSDVQNRKVDFCISKKICIRNVDNQFWISYKAILKIQILFGLIQKLANCKIKWLSSK